MSGHTSFTTSKTPEQKQRSTELMQKQQDMQLHATEDLFLEYKAKKRDKPITLVMQNGANCGCFAAGMAIASLIPMSQVKNLHESHKRESKLHEAESDMVWFSNFVAKKIQDTAQELNLSAIGEMFDAKALMTTINCVLENADVVGRKSAGKYLAKPAPCHSPKQLAELLTRASAMGVRVLIPYYSQASAPVLTSDGTQVPAAQMSHAHWSVVSPYPLGSSLGEIRNSTAPPLSLVPTSLVYLYEGHTAAIRMRYTIDQVARSNRCLGAAMDWNSYLNTRTRTERQETITALRKRTSNTPSSFQNAAGVRWLNSDIAYNRNEHLFETVKLRGQAILIGKKDDAPARAPAAPTPTSPPSAGETE